MNAWRDIGKELIQKHPDLNEILSCNACNLHLQLGMWHEVTFDLGTEIVPFCSLNLVSGGISTEGSVWLATGLGWL